MKLSKEDIKKYGTEKEIKKLNEVKMILPKKSWEFLDRIEDDGIDLNTDPDEYGHPDEKMTELQNITIIFDYPLNKEAKFNFYNKKGFTKKNFVKAVRMGYQKIYKNEDQYGVYGHDIEDLALVKANQVKPGFFRITVDS